MVFYSGWSEGRSADYKKGTYLNTNDYRTEEIIIAILNEMYAKLMDIYKEEENKMKLINLTLTNFNFNAQAICT